MKIFRQEKFTLLLLNLALFFILSCFGAASGTDETGTALSISISPVDTTISVDCRVQLSATVKPDTTADKTVTWSSSDNTIATVYDGLVNPEKTGTVIITATGSDGKTTARSRVIIEESINEFLISGPDSIYRSGSSTFLLKVKPQGCYNPFSKAQFTLY